MLNDKLTLATLTGFERWQMLHDLRLEKIKALDKANKALLQAQYEYDKIVKYYNDLGI